MQNPALHCTTMSGPQESGNDRQHQQHQQHSQHQQHQQLHRQDDHHQLMPSEAPSLEAEESAVDDPSPLKDEQGEEDESSAKKKKRYIQAFNEKWLRNPALQDWLERDPNDKYSAFCRVCNKSLRQANKYSLMHHKESVKHKKNASKVSCMIESVENLEFQIEQALIHYQERDTMTWFQRLFGYSKGVVIGVLHVPALPGTPCHQMSLPSIIKKVCEEARHYVHAGITGLMLENTHDVPYVQPDKVEPEITASMTAICYAVRQMYPELPIGLQILSAANKQALAVAHAAGLNFIRAKGFVFSYVGDGGMLDACAGELLRYRKHIGADNVKIFTDVIKKHGSRAVTSDVSISETAKTAELFLSDGVIVTGGSRGSPTSPDDVKEVREAVSLPVLVGSGVTIDNLHSSGAMSHANGCIVGSHFKYGGQWHNDVDFDRVERFMNQARKIQS